MPELPEVETIVRQLCSLIEGKKMIGVEVIDEQVVSPEIRKIVPCFVDKVERRGKLIIISVGRKFLLIHLRMTGHFRWDAVEDAFLVGKFYFENGCLSHHSIRKFGKIVVMNEKELEIYLERLGPDPLVVKEDEFCARLSGSKVMIKQKLLDQQFIAGVGNIYALEALYRAGINPQKRVREISKVKLVKLYRELQKVLRLAIANKGTTVDNYVHVDGSGGFQKLLQVYGKRKCPKGHRVKKIKLGGRGTYFCPVCQL